MSKDFISIHIIGKIKDELLKKKVPDDFYYFKDPITYISFTGLKRTIDGFKMSKYGSHPSIYRNTQFNWYNMTGYALLESFKRIRNDEFYSWMENFKD